MDVKGEALTTF